MADEEKGNTTDQAPPDLPGALRQLREELGLTQTQLAERLGVSLRTVARWESGESQPRRQQPQQRLAALAEETASKATKLALTGALLAAGWTPGFGVVSSLAAVSSAAAVQLVQRYRTNQRLSVRRLFQATAHDLDVDWEDFREALLPVLETASGLGLSLDVLIETLNAEDPVND